LVFIQTVILFSPVSKF
jgi:hypothetical protein